MQRDKLVTYLDDELDVTRFNAHEDAKFNGLLVAGKEDVTTIGLCTNFTWENIDAAKEQGLDFVISHHGGWEEFEGDLVAEKQDALEAADLSWYIAHEPLDCADDYGVAAVLADRLGIRVEGGFGAYCGGYAGRYGSLHTSKHAFLKRLRETDSYRVVDGEDRWLEDRDLEQLRFGVIGGGGGVYLQFLKEALDNEIDVLLTGNSAFYTDIYAFEQGLTLVTLEETSTEKWGVYALGEHLKERFDIEPVQIPERNW